MSVPVRPSPVPSRLVRAAGALTWRFRDFQCRRATPGEVVDPRDIEVLLVHRPHYKDWSWPKGKSEANEPILAAAVREIEEETGQIVALGAPLTTQRYRLGSGQTKEVRYWVGTAATKGKNRTSVPERTRPPVKRAPSSEIDDVRWVSPDEADAMLTRRGDRRLLAELVTRAKEGKLVTSTLVFMRHASPVPPYLWAGAESERPLNRLGVRQSIDLVALLSALGIEDAYSSPWKRCSDTLRIWADIGGADIQALDVLSEWGADTDPRAAQGLVKELVHRGCVPTVIASHQPTIPLLFDPVKDVAFSGFLRSTLMTSTDLAPAEMLVAHLEYSGDTPALFALEKHATRTKKVLGLDEEG